MQEGEGALHLQEEEVQPQVVGCSQGERADVPRLERPDRKGPRVFGVCPMTERESQLLDSFTSKNKDQSKRCFPLSLSAFVVLSLLLPAPASLLLLLGRVVGAFTLPAALFSDASLVTSLFAVRLLP